jgi:hypothetical protein
VRIERLVVMPHVNPIFLSVRNDKKRLRAERCILVIGLTQQGLKGLDPEPLRSNLATGDMNHKMLS